MIILFLGEHSNGDIVFIMVEYPTSLAAIQRSVSITPIQCLPAISQFPVIIELTVLLEYIDLLLYMHVQFQTTTWTNVFLWAIDQKHN